VVLTQNQAREISMNWIEIIKILDSFVKIFRHFGLIFKVIDNKKSPIL